MEAVVAATLTIVVGAILVSYWKELSFPIVASIGCVAVYILMKATDSRSLLEFAPRDLTNPERLYTILTSMFTHSDEHLGHLIFNVFVLIMMGLAFEQRIGTRPFVILYLLSGLAGTLTFATIRWNEFVAVIGASGAIMGILGGFARLYPTERVILFFLPPMPIWVVVVILIFMQYLFVGTNVAIESHLGGLAAGILLAPSIARVPKARKSERKVSLAALSRLAVTPELRTVLSRIEKEEVAEVRGAWIEHFLARARCPRCGAHVKIEDDSAICERGHII